MSIKLTSPILIAGAHVPVDEATLRYSAALEADLVNGNKAVYVKNPAQGGSVPLAATVEPVSGNTIVKAGNTTFLTVPSIPDISRWKGNDSTVIAETTLALKQSRNLTPHVSRAAAFSSVSIGASTTQFAGAVRVPNGDVVFAPFSNANVRFYRHSTGVVGAGTAHGEGAAAFAACVYSTAVDRVIFPPHDSDYVGIWTHIGTTYTRGPAHGEGATAFSGGCQIADGRIIFTPYTSLYVGIYDPVANTYTRGPAHGETLNAFECAAPLPNGDVIFSPIASSYVGIYTPDYAGGGIGTYTRGPAHGEGALAFQGCIPLPNGKMLLVPFNSAYVGLYTPTGSGAGTYTRGPAVSSATTGTTLQFCGGVLLADGRVLMIPRGCTDFVYYDWKTNTLQLGPAHGSAINSNMYVGAALIEDGVVVCAPFSSGNVGIVNTWMTPVRDEEFCMHPGWNHY